jgi:hypothetical protein
MRWMACGSRLWGDIGIVDVLGDMLDDRRVSRTRYSIGDDRRIDRMESIRYDWCSVDSRQKWSVCQWLRPRRTIRAGIVATIRGAVCTRCCVDSSKTTG